MIKSHYFLTKEIKLADFEFIEDGTPQMMEGSNMQILGEWSLLGAHDTARSGCRTAPTIVPQLVLGRSGTATRRAHIRLIPGSRHKFGALVRSGFVRSGYLTK
jgi:hypothetical protein